MIRHPARRWIVLLALAGSALTASATGAQTPFPMEFPPPGTRCETGLGQLGTGAELAGLPQTFVFGLTGVGR